MIPVETLTEATTDRKRPYLRIDIENITAKYYRLGYHLSA